MRIVGRKFRGFKLNSPNNIQIRPTSDRLKESIFSIIESEKYSNCIEGKFFLDLFTGTGSIGLEAFSRGADTVYLLDKNSESIELSKKNIIKLNLGNLLEKQLFLLKTNILNLNNLSLPIFDFIYIDPPYKTNYFNKILDILKKNKNLNSDTLIFLESDKNFNFFHKDFKILTTKNYGLSFLHILKPIYHCL